jgi:hypothetical protein
VATYYGINAYYPSSIKTDFGTRINFTETILNNHVNAVQSEIQAIETTLGSNVQTGSGWVGTFDTTTVNWATLKDRITNIEYGLYNVYTAVPAGGTTGQVLTKSSGSDYDSTWTTFNALPTFTDNAGKYLTNDGTQAQWQVVETTISSFLLIGA